MSIATESNKHFHNVRSMWEYIVIFISEGLMLNHNHTLRKNLAKVSELSRSERLQNNCA